MIVELRNRWDRTVDALGVTGRDADVALDDLLRRHAEPHRRYHAVEHLAEIHHALDLLADPPDELTGVTDDDPSLAVAAADDPAVRLAAWFHDAIHDPTADDNEVRSAALSSLVLERMGVDPDVGVLVDGLIEVTRHHRPDPGDERACALADADLSIFGATPERYVRYRRQVRAEYEHLDDVTWRAGRIEVLSGFLERQPLYSTDAGRALWGEPARANLWAERELLRHDR